MTLVRKIQGYGWRPDLPDHRDRIFNLERKVCRAVELPEVFSLRSQMPPVYDQGQLGSCTGNGVAAVLERTEIKQGDAPVTPSRLFIYYNERVIEGTVGQDSGAQIRDGIKVVASEGAPPEPIWPYDIARFAEKPSAEAYERARSYEAIQYLRVLPGEAGSPIRSPINEGLPVVFGFSVPALFESATWRPATQYLPLPAAGEESIGGHCVVVVGWDFSLKKFPVNVFEIRNSWGPGWGDEGHFWMDARWLSEPTRGLSSDFWVIDRVS
ncbi:MAG TPA: C1 family peptidase [Solirubrobacteraceae bacterium]|jgi:C1A family cysteine protease|nr:C1 family peptidase [Solirubrobacteraceae bacterium]